MSLGEHPATAEHLKKKKKTVNGVSPHFSGLFATDVATLRTTSGKICEDSACRNVDPILKACFFFVFAITGFLYVCLLG